MEIEFDFRKEKSGLFKSIYRPVAKLTLIYKNKSVPEIFYVDTGADITIIPRSIGEILAFDNPSPVEINDIKGLGEKSVPVVIRKVMMVLGDYKIKSQIGWALIEDVPLLLGREDFFKYFDVIFKRNKKVVFTN